MRNAKRIRELIAKNRSRLDSPPIAPEHAAFLMDDIDQLKYELSYAVVIEELVGILQVISEWKDEDPSYQSVKDYAKSKYTLFKYT